MSIFVFMKILGSRFLKLNTFFDEFLVMVQFILLEGTERRLEGTEHISGRLRSEVLQCAM